MSGEDAPMPYLEDLIVPEIKTNTPPSAVQRLQTKSDDVGIS
jgi:hypothetical protein